MTRLELADAIEREYNLSSVICLLVDNRAMIIDALRSDGEETMTDKVDREYQFGVGSEDEAKRNLAMIQPDKAALADRIEQCPLCPWPGSDLSFVAGMALQGHERDMIVAALRADDGLREALEGKK